MNKGYKIYENIINPFQTISFTISGEDTTVCYEDEAMSALINKHRVIQSCILDTQEQVRLAVCKQSGTSSGTFGFPFIVFFNDPGAFVKK